MLPPPALTFREKKMKFALEENSEKEVSCVACSCIIVNERTIVHMVLLSPQLGCLTVIFMLLTGSYEYPEKHSIPQTTNLIQSLGMNEHDIISFV